MRIGIDGRPLEQERTVVARYLLSLLRVWAKEHKAHEYYLYFEHEIPPGELAALSLQIYQQARRVLQARFLALAAQGRKRMVFYGVGEAAELAYLCAREMDLELVGVVDAERAGRRFLDQTVLDPARLPGLEYDCIVITSFDDGNVLREELEAMGIAPGAVVTMRP